MLLRIKRLDPAVGLPEPATGGAAGFDLSAATDIEIPPRQIRLVGTGLVIAVPDGYFLGIFARSSTPLKRGLMVANGVGVIDADYCGPADEMKIQVLNVTDAPVIVTRGDRLAQGIVLPARASTWEEVTRWTAHARRIRQHRIRTACGGCGCDTCGRSSTSTWTRSTRRSNSATTRRCAASRSPSAAIRQSAAWWRRPATRRGKFGVRSAIPMSRAVRLCPALVIVRPDFAKYRTVSQQVFTIYPCGHAARRAAVARRGVSRRHRERVGRTARREGGAAHQGPRSGTPPV